MSKGVIGFSILGIVILVGLGIWVFDGGLMAADPAKKPAGPFPAPAMILPAVQENCFVPMATQAGSKLQVVVVDGQAEPEIDGIGQGYPVNSFDGKTVGFVAGRGNRQYVVVNGQTGPEYDGILAGSLVICFNGASWAYTAKKSNGWVVVVNGKEGPAYDGAGAATITMDGSHVAYPVRRGQRYCMVINDKPEKEYDGVFGPMMFSMDGAHWAYLAMSNDKYCVVADGKEGPMFDNITGLRYTNIYYPSPDNKLVYIGTRATQ
jgi:hypothetical protein